MTTNNNGNKVLTWFMGALASLASYVAVVQNKRVGDIEKSRQEDKTYYQAVVANRDAQISKVTREKDSLNGVIVKRSDNSYEELKKILDFKSNRSTIVIKPKPRRK